MDTKYTPKYTPGPWSARKVCLSRARREDGYETAWAIEQPGHMPHATVFERMHGDDTEQARRDALLIAAAPQLLESCRALLEICRNKCSPRDTDGAANEAALIAACLAITAVDEVMPRVGRT